VRNSKQHTIDQTMTRAPRHGLVYSLLLGVSHTPSHAYPPIVGHALWIEVSENAHHSLSLSIYISLSLSFFRGMLPFFRGMLKGHLMFTLLLSGYSPEGPPVNIYLSLSYSLTLLLSLYLSLSLSNSLSLSLSLSLN
jgi:hypothetical protein